jgi:hypothetical protein
LLSYAGEPGTGRGNFLCSAEHGSEGFAGNGIPIENMMKQAASLNFEIGIYLPGTWIKTSPTDFAPLEQLQMMRFKDESWELFGPLMSAE